MTQDAPLPELQHVSANGLDVAYYEMGEGPLVLLLHGFPDCSLGFRQVARRLADAGFRAVVPSLRGYAPTSLAPDGDYSLQALGKDVIAQLEHFGGGEQAFVVGHDWGSAITQYAANLRPDRFRRIVLSSVPHLRRFLLSPSRAQLKRSHYIFKFQVPRWAEKRIPRDDFAWLREFQMRRWSPGYAFSAAELAPIIEGFSQPGRLSAALAYYRGIPRAITHLPTARTAFAKVVVPTRMLYGSEDGAIGPEMFQRQEKRFAAEFDLVRGEGLGHFLQYEAPDWYADQVIGFFRR